MISGVTLGSFGSSFWGLQASFLMPVGFRSRTWRVRAGTQNQKQLFQFSIDVGVCTKVLRRVLAAAGALFSLWRPVANNVDVWLHFEEMLGAKSSTTHFRVPESIFGGKMGCRSIGDFLWISKGSQDSRTLPS